MMAPATATVPEYALSFLVDAGLAERSAKQSWTPLTGGVSSQLWLVDLPGRQVCVKGALAKLNVQGDWFAPVSRNAVEWAWLQFAAKTTPVNVPEPLAHDPNHGLLAMNYLPPSEYPVWKGELLNGRIDVDAAAAVGTLIGRLHAASIADSAAPLDFATDYNFHQLRIAPYFESIQREHIDLTAPVQTIIDDLQATHIAVVHGDVSPKNILIGRQGPVLLDAECAWFGDPAFDLAFVLSHLLLKRFVTSPRNVIALAASTEALLQSYANEVAWEPVSNLRKRAARLLLAVLPARVDGMSPVEYLRPTDQETVRVYSRTALLSGETDLYEAVGRAGSSFNYCP